MVKKIFAFFLLLVSAFTITTVTNKAYAIVLSAEVPIYIKTIGASGSGNGQFNIPYGMTTDASGNLYVVDSQNHRVQVFNSAGVYVRQFGSYGVPGLASVSSTPTPSISTQIVFPVTFNAPSGIVIDSTNGDMFVTDTGNNRIVRASAAGAYLDEFGSIGDPGQTLNGPRSIAIGPDNNLYVTDTGNDRVVVFTKAGEFVRTIGGPAILNVGDPVLLDGPEGIVVDASGNVYIADTLHHRIVEASPPLYTEVASFGTYGTGDGQFDHPAGLAADAAGNLLVTDALNSRVQKFTSNGAFLTKFGSAGAGAGQFSLVLGVTVTNTGYVYVADSVNNRVQKFIDHTPSALKNVYFTFGHYGYNKYVSPYALRTGDRAYIKNFNTSQLRLLQVFLYDYAKHGNQGYAKSSVTSTSMYLRTSYLLPTGKRYAYVFKFQDKASGVIATKYFVVYTTKTWLGHSTL